MSHASPGRMLLIVVASMFLAEAIVLALVSDRHPTATLLAAVLDALLVFPALYFFGLRPLQRYLAERDRAESELARSTELLDRLFSITHLMLAYMDPQFNFIRVNRAYAQADEKTPEEFIGRNHFEMFPHPENEGIFRRAVETGEPHFAYAKPFEYALTPNRGITYWDWSVIPIKNSEGQVEGLILSLVDVTERKRAEIALAENEALLRKVLEALPVGVWILNQEGRIVHANPASQEIWGGVRLVGIEDFGQYKAWWLESGKLIEPQEWSAARSILKGESSFGEEMEIEAFDGTRKIILNSAAPLLRDTGSVIGAIVVSRDITQRKQAEQQIQRSNRELEALIAAEQKARRTADVLRQAGLALTQSLDMAVVMDALLDVTGHLVPYDSASILLVEDEDHLVVHAARGCDWAGRLGGRVVFDRESDQPLEQLIADRQGKVLPDVSPDLARKITPCDHTTRSWLGVPFVAGEHVIGLCCLGKEQAAFYTAEHLQLAEALASQAAVAVQNAWLFAQLRESRQRLQTLSHRLVEVQENERGYVARELHDEAGQVLASLMLGLRLLARHAHEPEAIIAGIDELKGTVDLVLENLHRLAMNLRPASLDHLGLEVALRQHLETIADRNNLTVQMETVGMDLRLPKDTEVALYRIVQEALANVVRHSQATRVDVLLKRDGGKVVAVVEDNGVGFAEDVALNSGRLGLFGMRERAEMLGGRLLVECGRSGGTTVLVEVPCGDSPHHC